MNIRRLTVIRMPGFEEQGFSLDELSQGLNLVIGPNASGKTTACRAIQGLLWPETLSDVSPVALLGEWVEDGDVLLLRVEGTRRTCQRDGAPAEAPPLPGSHLATCFTITIDDLFEGKDTDDALAARVAREMAGGYDLNAVRQTDVLSLSRTHGRKELDALKKARETVRTIQAEQGKLRAEELELTRLEKRAEETGAAQSRLGRLADVRQLIKVRADMAQWQASLSGFARGMDRLRGNEADSLRQIRADLEESRGALAQESAAAGRAAQQKADARLPEGGIPEMRLAEQRVHLEKLQEAERNLEDVAQRLAEAEEKAQATLKVLGEEADADKLGALDRAGLNEIEGFQRKTEAIEAKRSALRERLALLSETPDSDPDTLTLGVKSLRDWLEATPSESPAHRRVVGLAWALAVTVTAVGVGLGVSDSPWWFLLLLASGLAVLALVQGKGAAADLRQLAEAHFARLPLQAPQAWERSTVGRHLTMVEQALGRAHQAHAQQTERKAHEAQLNALEAAEADLDRGRADLIERLGVAPDTSNLALVVLAANLLTYQQARTIRDTCRGTLTQLRETRAKHAQAVNAFLGEFGQERCDGFDVARVRCESVFERARSHREAKAQWAAARSKAADAESRISKLEERKRQLFDAAGLADDEDTELEDRIERLAECQEATHAVNALQAQEAALAAKIEDLQEWVGLEPEQLDAEEERLRGMAESHDDLIGQIKGIRLRVDEAGRQSALEAASAELDRATDQLRERRDEATLAAAGSFLLDDVEAEHEVESQPQVLRDAAKWFGLFTRGRHELRVVGQAQSGTPAFLAMDTASGRGLGLKELSRGTRMQLLLAVRLAFASAAERGTELPFVLDEVLSSTDPIRFRAIAECLLALVQEGRQVLYFTCQPGDAAAWQEVAEEVGVDEPRRIELADAQRRQAITSGLLTDSTVQTAPVPAPGSMGLSEYAEAVGGAGLQPEAGAAAAHLAYLVDDAEQLYALLQASIETYGQLLSLASLGAVDAYVSDGALARIQARGRVLEAFCEAWAVGRGRRLSQEALCAGGVSESYIERVAGLAGDLGWDAERLMQALHDRTDERAKGFRTNVLEALTESLTQSGHLDPRPKLSKGDLLSQVLAAANDVVKRGVMDATEVGEWFEQLCVLGDVNEPE